MQTCLLTHWTQRSEMSKRCQFCSSWNCLRHAFLLFLSSSMSNTHWRLNTCMLIIDLCMVLRAGGRSKCVLTHWQGEFFESVLPSSVFLLSPKKAHASLRNAIKEKNGISSLEAVWLLFFWGVKKKKKCRLLFARSPDKLHRTPKSFVLQKVCFKVYEKFSGLFFLNEKDNLKHLLVPTQHSLVISPDKNFESDWNTVTLL